MKRVYLDYNSTTPVHPSVADAMSACLREAFGNPSSTHHFGDVARGYLDRARRQVAELIGADPDEIVFVSGGTEADNQALWGMVEYCGRHRAQVVTSAIEHPAVLNTCRRLELRGNRVTYVPVDSCGRVSLDAVGGALDDDTALVSIMLANNEVGTIQPVAEIVEVARARGVRVHTDAVQAVGKIPVDVNELGVELLSLSAHKMYGPKGVGALYLRHGTRLSSLLAGGDQEDSRRAGTENLPGIVGFGEACRLALRSSAETATQTRALRDRLEQELRRRIAGVQVNGHPVHRLPNTLSVSFAGVDGETLALNLDVLGIAVSTGSACTSRSVGPSRVLTAMGCSSQQALASVRLSLGADNTEQDVDVTVEAVVELVRQLRGAQPAPQRTPPEDHTRVAER